jgi:hypothetical protein
MLLAGTEYTVKLTNLSFEQLVVEYIGATKAYYPGHPLEWEGFVNYIIAHYQGAEYGNLFIPDLTKPY